MKQKEQKRNRIGYFKSPKGDMYANYLVAESWIEVTKEEYEAHTHHELSASEKEKARIRREIAVLKSKLAATDYKCLKFVDGALTEEEYTEVKTERQALRDEINELESQL